MCVAAALLLAFVATPLIQMNLSHTRPVVVMTTAVPLGAELTAEMLTLHDMGEVNLPEGTVLRIEDAVGQYLTIPAAEGDILTQLRLTDRFPTDDPVLTTLPEGMMAVSANLSELSQSVSGKLRAGDVIQIFAVLSNSNTPENVDYHALEVPELQRVEVLSVTNADAMDIKDGTALVPGESDRQISTITLAVNTAQASALAGLDHTATLHAALVVRGDAQGKANALEQQSAYFAKAEEAAVTPTPSASPAPVVSPAPMPVATGSIAGGGNT